MTRLLPTHHAAALRLAAIVAIVAAIACLLPRPTNAAPVDPTIIGTPLVTNLSSVGPSAGWTLFTIDFGNPATHDGTVTSFEADMVATSGGAVGFLLVDPSFTVRYVSPEIPAAEATTHTPPAPIAVSAGWMVGVYIVNGGQIRLTTEDGTYDGEVPDTTPAPIVSETLPDLAPRNYRAGVRAYYDPTARLTSPEDEATLTPGDTAFTRDSVDDALAYYLWFGSTPGAVDIAGFAMPNTELDLGSLPVATVSTVYARLWTQFADRWDYRDYSFTYDPRIKATLTAPPHDAATQSDVITVGRTAGSAVDAYYLWLGKSPGSAGLLGLAMPGTTLEITRPDGFSGSAYLTLWTLFTDGSWASDSLLFPWFPPFEPAELTAPTDGTPITNTRATFTRTSADGAVAYYLWVGSAPGLADITGFAMPATELTVYTLPVGPTLYVRLWTQFEDGSWQFNDYTYPTVAP